MKTCLIVEDSDAVREVACDLVSEIGLDPREASDPASATTAVEEGLPDVVLLDWNLPGMGAVEFLRALKSRAGDAKPVVILCAAEYDPDQFALAKAAGANDYVLKPYDLNTLRAKFTEHGFA